MSIFNRVVVVIASLAVLAGAVITFLVAVGVSGPDILPRGWFESELQTVADATGGSAAGIAAVGVIIALVMLTILFFELVPWRKPAILLTGSDEKGITTIDAESICLLAEKTGANIHAVHDVNCHLKGGLAGLLISCRASLILGTNMPEASAELRRDITEAVEQLTGLLVAKVDIELKYEPAEARRLAVH